jgi:hypothetical protein
MVEQAIKIVMTPKGVITMRPPEPIVDVWTFGPAPRSVDVHGWNPPSYPHCSDAPPADDDTDEEKIVDRVKAVLPKLLKKKSQHR